MIQVKRTFDILEKYAHEFPKKKIALAGKDSEGLVTYSTDEYLSNSYDISYGLLRLGVRKGDRIASITHNRAEWNFLDMGILQTGAIHIPIYPTISDADYEYILKHAQVSFIFVAGAEMYKRIKHIIDQLPNLKAIYTFRDLNGIQHLNELIELGKKNRDKVILDNAKNNVSEDDTATIIYTSGTTGVPKGVILSHKNLVSNFIACSKVPPYGPDEVAMSFLPICHIYERMLNYMYQYLGLTIYSSGSIANIADNFKEFNPHIFSTVPRLLEKIFNKVIAKSKSLKGIKKLLFRWSMDFALNYEIEKESNFFYAIRLKLARVFVLNKIKAIFGTNIDIVVSGGAALQTRLCRFYWALGMKVLEGYGLTETSPVLTVNMLEKHGTKFGTVGLPVEGVQIKIAPDGEILCKTPGLMQSYYKEDALTKEVIDSDGWFHTGDIGVLEPTGHLKITDRKKLIFKTSFGKYIAPQLIENVFKESIYIDQLMVFGENQKFAAALIVPEFQALKEWSKENKIITSSREELIKHPEVIKLFKSEVARFNATLGDFERIVQFELLHSDWSIESGELSATLKVRRTYVNNTYKEQMRKIFPEI